MGWYLLKLLVLLPLIGLLIWGSLKLTQKLQTGLVPAGARGKAGRTSRERSVRIVETQMLSPGLKLAVLEFHGREILVSATRNGLTRLAEVSLRQERPLPADRAAQPWEIEE